MRVLVTCATGRIGSVLVPALQCAGHEVAVLSRSPAKVEAFGTSVVTIEGDMTDPVALRRAIEDRDALVLIGAGEMELYGNLFAVEAVSRSASVEHVVYISTQNPEAMCSPPTEAPKLLTEKALYNSGVAATVLRPNTFMQSDLSLRETICAGIYPVPFGSRGVARVDVNDLAAATLTVLGDPSHIGRIYTICGPENLNGPQIAETWAVALNRDVTYMPLDLDEFEALARTEMSALLAHGLRMQFARYQLGALLAVHADMLQVKSLLGRTPRSFANFTAEAAASWMARLG